jgi:glycosyltransferase involved in cell wall biosynthesis
MHLVIATLRAYPFGGGEECLREYGAEASAAGHRVTWVCFGDSLQRPFRVRGQHRIEGGIVVEEIPGPFKTETLVYEIARLRPDVVTSLGAGKRMVAEACVNVGVPSIIGWHYWTEGIALGAATGNVEILRHAESHAAHANLEDILRLTTVPYVVSPFVQRVFREVAGVTVPRVIQPLFSDAKIESTPYDPRDASRDAVVCFNVHPHKSGWALVHAAHGLPGVHFIALRPEPFSDPIFERALAAAAALPNVTLLTRVDDTRPLLRRARAVLSPSVCDETFGRVAFEAMLSGVPVVLSRRGNYPYYAGGSAAVFVADPTSRTDVVRALSDLLADAGALARCSVEGLRMARGIREQSRASFTAALEDAVALQRRGGGPPRLPSGRPLGEGAVMLFSLWGEQGLGYQCKAYAHALRRLGRRCVVFSFCSYHREGDALASALHSDLSEWVHGRVHYSAAVREKVTDEEVLAVARAYGVDCLILPETCWYRVFQIAALLRAAGVRTVGVPNIEIVRRDEIESHRAFDALACNNGQAQRVLRDAGLGEMSVPLGFSPMHVERRRKYARDLPQTCSFLFVCGWNGRRKNVTIAARAFRAAVAACPGRLTLTVLAQAASALTAEARAAFDDTPGVRVIVGELTHGEVLQHIDACHAVISISRNEGLGLSMYESLARGTPLLVHRAPPNDEIVIPLVNGWVVDVAEFTPLSENTSALVHGAVTCPLDLERHLCALSALSPAEWQAVFDTTWRDLNGRDCPDRFCARLRNLILNVDSDTDTGLDTGGSAEGVSVVPLPLPQSSPATGSDTTQHPLPVAVAAAVAPAPAPAPGPIPPAAPGVPLKPLRIMIVSRRGAIEHVSRAGQALVRLGMTIEHTLVGTLANLDDVTRSTAAAAAAAAFRRFAPHITLLWDWDNLTEGAVRSLMKMCPCVVAVEDGPPATWGDLHASAQRAARRVDLVVCSRANTSEQMLSGGCRRVEYVPSTPPPPAGAQPADAEMGGRVISLFLGTTRDARASALGSSLDAVSSALSATLRIVGDAHWKENYPTGYFAPPDFESRSRLGTLGGVVVVAPGACGPQDLEYLVRDAVALGASVFLPAGIVHPPGVDGSVRYYSSEAEAIGLTALAIASPAHGMPAAATHVPAEGWATAIVNLCRLTPQFEEWRW